MPVVQSVKRWDTPASGVWHATSFKVIKVAISTFQGKNALMVEDCLRPHSEDCLRPHFADEDFEGFFSVFATFFFGALPAPVAAFGNE